MAVSSPDYELALIDVGIDQPPINLLLQQLRHDDRSADLRMGLIAREGFTERAEHAAGHDPLTMAFPGRTKTPRSPGSCSNWPRYGRMNSFPSSNASARRARHWTCSPSWAQSWQIVRHAPGRKSRFNGAQYAFAQQKGDCRAGHDQFARSPTGAGPDGRRSAMSLEVRQAALSAFRQNVQTHGILLTTEEIKTQYQQYNGSQNQDEPTKKILGLILDCLEAPTKTENR